MLVSIAYSILSPLIVSHIEELVVGDFELKSLFIAVGVYAGVLIVSLTCTHTVSKIEVVKVDKKSYIII